MMRLFLLTFMSCLAAIGFSEKNLLGQKIERDVTIDSDAMGGEATFRVIVPPEQTINEYFPVIYVLHGAYGSYTDWPENSDAARMAVEHGVILVFPDGGEFGWYVDDDDDEAMQYETFIIEELIPYVDRYFPTDPRASRRAIMGLSMGGHGAITLAAKHPEIFNSASSLSGILNLTNHPESWEIAERLGSYEENQERWEANSAYHLAENLKESGIHLFFDCGIDDTATGAITDNREFHQRLTELGIPHIWKEKPGSHDWDYWSSHLAEHIEFHKTRFQHSEEQNP